MRKIILLLAITSSAFVGACKKEKANGSDEYGNGPRTDIPASLQGNWMHGSFSMTEYWSQNPADYLGNALELAMAFHFHANGNYEQYFTFRTVSGGVTSYHQSVTKGTAVLNETNKTIITYAQKARYKQTRNGTTIENRDLSENEITKTTMYTYELKTELNGTKAVYLKLNGTGSPLQFLQKF